MFIVAVANDSLDFAVLSKRMSLILAFFSPRFTLSGLLIGIYRNFRDGGKSFGYKWSSCRKIVASKSWR